MERRKHDEEMFEFEYAGLRDSAEFNRMIAADDVFARILRIRTEIAICWTENDLQEKRRVNALMPKGRKDEKGEANLFRHAAELRARHEELIATHFETDPETLVFLQDGERQSALEEGMADHVAAWALSRTVEAFRGRADEPLAVADVARRYVFSEEGRIEALEQMSSYMEGTLAEEPDEYPEADVVLDAVVHRLSVVRERVMEAGQEAGSPVD